MHRRSERIGELGRLFNDGDVIIHRGEAGECMYVIQSGRVEIVREDAPENPLAILGPGSFFGEMALFDRTVRSATVRAIGEVRVLTVDKRTLLSRIREDPLLAYELLRTLSDRVRKLNDQLSGGSEVGV